jgi:exopolyphosphatase / guanosine-5'-triphosphate,3'-diphosphate pyrophosphatase
VRVAALDLGSNTFLCLIAEINDSVVTEVISDQVEVVRLGQGVNSSKRFHPDALVRARTCLEKFKTSIDHHKPERVLAMATSAARDVHNKEELLEIGKNLGIPIEIIPGDREAQISYQGSTSGMPVDKKIRAVIDVGGGSTEIIVGQGQKVLWGASANVGAVRMTEMFPDQSNTLSLENHVNEALKPLFEKLAEFKIEQVIGAAGTPTELASATIGGFDPVKVEGFLLDNGQLENWIRLFKNHTPNERTHQLKISAGRADVILAGTLILKLALEGLQKCEMTVTTRGIRFGVALELARRTR